MDDEIGVAITVVITVKFLRDTLLYLGGECCIYGIGMFETTRGVVPYPP